MSATLPAVSSDPVAAADTELSAAKFALLSAESAAYKLRNQLVSAEVDVKCALIRIQRAQEGADAALAAKYTGARYYFTGAYAAGGGWGGPDWSEDVQAIPRLIRAYRANLRNESFTLVTETRTKSGRWGNHQAETFEVSARAVA